MASAPCVLMDTRQPSCSLIPGVSTELWPALGTLVLPITMQVRQTEGPYCVSTV